MARRIINYQKEELDAFCKKYGVRQLALFGSAVYGNFRPESDIDLLVVFNNDTLVSFMILGRMTRELSAIFQRPVDLVLKEGLKPVIRESIIANSEEIYAA